MNKIILFTCLFIFFSNSLFAQNVDSKDSIDYNPKWVLFETKEFSSKFPDKKPKKRRVKKAIVYGTENQIEQQEIVFAVSKKKMKLDKNTSLTREQGYENIRNNIDEIIIPDSSVEDIEINGIPCLQVYGTIKGLKMRLVFIINHTSKTLFMLNVIGERPITESDFADEFIYSFKFK